MAKKIDIEKLSKQYAEAIEASLQERSRMADVAMNTFLADTITRIFTDGKDVNGADIGQYSTKPMYFPVENKFGSQIRSSSLKPRGKNGSKDRKSMYFPGGYKEFRSTVGRRSDKVDLALTMELMNDLKLYRDGDKLFVGVSQDLSANKIAGNEKRFGKVIFSATEQDLDKIADTVFDATAEAFFSKFTS